MDDVNFIILVLIIALILSVLHYLSEWISKFMENHHYRVLSLSAGTMIGLLFLVLLPEIIHISTEPVIFLLIVGGFTIFHLTEKFLYQHVTDKREKLKELKLLHATGFFIDHFILGFVLVTTLEITFALGFIILIPIFLHTLSSSIALDHIHEKAKTKVNKIVLSSSTFIGALVAILLEINETIQIMILAFIFGMLLYIVSRDVIPREGKGSSNFFVIGLLIVIAVWLAIIFQVG
jgi:zinc transporter ZupT